MRYYRLNDAARMLGIQVRTLREWIKLGKIKAVKDASNDWYWLIPEDEVAKHLETLEDAKDEEKSCQ